MDDLLRGRGALSDPSRDRYEELCGKVEAFHERVEGRYPGALTCHAGCSMCCQKHLGVFELEFDRIAAAVQALPEAEKSALRARLRAGRDDPRCPLLDDTGRCRVYAARPMICRTHGLPIAVGEPKRRDVCPLNFGAGPDVDAIDAEAVLDVNRINAILALMAQLAGRDGRVDLIDGLSELLAL